MARSLRARRAAALLCALALALVLSSAPAPADSVKILYHFSLRQEGVFPAPGLAEGPDGRLYGATNAGGRYGYGTLFSVEPDGTDYQVLLEFDDTTSGGAPAHLLIGSDGRVYGLTGEVQSPASSPGALFSVRRDGTDYKVLHTFSASEGEAPTRLIEIDGRFYGTTRRGGTDPSQGVTAGSGTLFSVLLDGSDFRLLKVFSSDRDGSDPLKGVTLGADGRLYGTTQTGGLHGGGTLYSIDRSGANFVVHRHSPAPERPFLPQGRVLAASDGYLYVILQRVLLRFLPGGVDQTVLIDITAVPGWWGFGSELTETSGGRIHGTVSGAAANELFSSGMFAVNRDGTGFDLQVVFDNDNEENPTPRIGHPALLLASNGRLYVTAGQGGRYFQGVLLTYKPDGSDLQAIHTFGADFSEGHNPIAGVVYARNHRLYGLAGSGGRPIPMMRGAGTLYSLNPDGSDFRVHRYFGKPEVGSGPGAEPYRALLRSSNGLLYGSTFSGGDYERGTIFSFTPGSHQFRILRHLRPEDGGRISAPLVEGPDGMLFGVNAGSRDDFGTVFSLHRTGRDFKLLHAFSRLPVNIGEYPQAIVLTHQGKLLVSTSPGSTGGNRGTTVLLDRDGSNVQLLQTFFPADQRVPLNLMRPSGPWIVGTSATEMLRAHRDGLQFESFGPYSRFQPPPHSNQTSSEPIEASDGRLYAAVGAPYGAHGEGAIYSLDPSGLNFHVHHHFEGVTAGMVPRARFSEGPDGTLYGTGRGGRHGEGAVFAFIRGLQVIAGPEDASLIRNVQARLVVYASGPGPLYYHWYRNGKLIHRSGNNTLDLGRAEPGDAGRYHVLVKNRYGSVTSRTATVAVQ